MRLFVSTNNYILTRRPCMFLQKLVQVGRMIYTYKKSHVTNKVQSKQQYFFRISNYETGNFRCSCFFLQIYIRSSQGGLEKRVVPYLSASIFGPSDIHIPFKMPSLFTVININKSLTLLPISAGSFYKVSVLNDRAALVIYWQPLSYHLGLTIILYSDFILYSRYSINYLPKSGRTFGASTSALKA